jgi:hypothetical protein
LGNVIKELQRGRDFQNAMQSGLGVDYSVIESDWDIFKARQRFIFDLAILQYLGLIIIGILSVITPFIWRRRSRRKMEELAEDSEAFELDESYVMNSDADRRDWDYEDR